MTGKQSQFEADNPINLGIRRQDNDNARPGRVGIGRFLARAAVAGTIAISALIEIPGLIGGDLNAYAQTASQSGQCKPCGATGYPINRNNTARLLPAILPVLSGKSL